jgi:diamine N-acetyltransferase
MYGPSDAKLRAYCEHVLSELRLEPVTQENVRAACKLNIRADQADLVAPVAWSLADAYTAPDIAWPRLIYDDDQLVGFIMAAFDPGNPAELYHSYLWRLNISAEHQGSGYGRFAVESLGQEATCRGQHRLTVSYHLHENGPEGFYNRLGFRPTGEYNQGEIVAERILTTTARTGSGHSSTQRDHAVKQRIPPGVEREFPGSPRGSGLPG